MQSSRAGLLLFSLAAVYACGAEQPKSPEERLLELVMELVTQLEAGSEAKRKEIAKTLVGLGAVVVLLVTRLLSHEDAELRKHIVFILGAIGPAAGESAEALLELVKDDNQEVRDRALLALCSVCLQRVDLLVQALEHTDPVIEAAAIGTLERIAHHPLVLPKLIEALGHRSEKIRVELCSVLGKLGPAAAQAVPALSRAFAVDSTAVRVWAAIALGKIGKAAVRALPELKAALQSATGEYRSVLLRAIKSLEKDS